MTTLSKAAQQKCGHFSCRQEAVARIYPYDVADSELIDSWPDRIPPAQSDWLEKQFYGLAVYYHKQRERNYLLCEKHLAQRLRERPHFRTVNDIEFIRLPERDGE